MIVVYGRRMKARRGGCSIASCSKRRCTKSNTSSPTGPPGCISRSRRPCAFFNSARSLDMTELGPVAQAIIAGRHADPFSYLGPHVEDHGTVLRVFLPGAESVMAFGDNGERRLDRLDPAGLFVGTIEGLNRYRLRARYGDNDVELEDPYRFPPVLSDYDLYLLGEGTHLRLYEKLGAHPMTIDDVDGVAFVVWAPNSRRISVVGDFNLWDGRRHAMRVRGNGYCEIFVPGARAEQKYKYEIVAPSGDLLPLKSDPVGFDSEMRPATASIVIDSARLPQPAPSPANINALDAPISIYEVHLGSWRRKGENGQYWLTYRELAEQLP